MTQTTRRNTALLLAAVLALPAASCETLSDPAMAGALGSGLGAAGLHGLIQGRGHRAGVGAATAAAVAIATHLIVVSTYRASAEQEAIAQERARAEHARYRKTARAKGTRYVAVPVPKRKNSRSKGSNDLMLADAESGKLVSGKVYEVDNAKMNNGVARLGNHDALLYSGYRGI